MFPSHMKKIKLTLIVLTIDALLLVGQFALTTSRATDGDRLAKLNQLQAELNDQNQNLRLEVYNLSSLPSISAKASAANFAPANTVAWTPPPVALAP